MVQAERGYPARTLGAIPRYQVLGLATVLCREGVPEVVQHGETGFWVPEGDKELHRRLSERTVEHVRGKFELCRINRRLQNLYDQISGA